MDKSEIIESRTERLRNSLIESLQEEISLTCQHHGTKTFTIGNFLDNETVCTTCKSELPVWHRDQLVHPVMTALTKMHAEEERERREAEAKAKKEVA